VDTDTQRAIELADAIRYIDRRRAEDAKLGCPDTKRPDLPATHRFTHRFRAGEPRTTVHGVATIPGYTPTPQQVEDVAAGRCVDTVRVKRSEDDHGTIHTVRDFRRNGSAERVRQVAQVSAPETTRHNPAMRHDYNV
jgi:hypothetical protein